MSEELDYDSLIIGAGIGGIQTAIDLGDLGHKVLMVEKNVSIGGTMIQLSKVFPTLDCASCITTPKMSSAYHHENVDVRTLSEVTKFNPREDGSFDIQVLQHSKYVDADKCTGCNDCAAACPVMSMDTGYDQSIGMKRSVGVPFATALPQKAVLDMENCIMCGRCANACPTEAIIFDMEDEYIDLKVGSVVIATGFYETPNIKETYGGGNFHNVVTSKQMERLLAPTGPSGGIFRPGDGKSPWSIAYVQCAGSRDDTIGVPYCSAICCMFAIKQAMLLSAAAPLADITIYNMDIRTFGKGHDEFYETAKSMGINFVKGKIARMDETDEGDIDMHVETFDWDPSKKVNTHDLVVLSLGVVPQFGEEMKKLIPVELNADGFIKEIRLNSEPGLTSIPGVFVVGAATGPKDIVDSIVSGSAVSTKVSLWLQGELRDSFRTAELPVVMGD